MREKGRERLEREGEREGVRGRERLREREGDRGERKSAGEKGR